MSDPVLVAIIGLIGSLITIIVSKIFEKLISRAGNAAQREESFAAGLRADLSRKDMEISNLRVMLTDTDRELDKLRLSYWRLWETNMRLRQEAMTAAIKAGYSEEQIISMLPPLPVAPEGL